LDERIDRAAAIGTEISLRGIALNAKTHKVYAVDAAARTTKKIKVGSGPEALDPAGHRVYVASTVANTVTVIDETAKAVVGTVHTENRPYAIAVDSLTHTAFIAGLEGEKLVLVDGQTFKVTAAEE
jgi:YVTN family beta-propeller protein